MSTLTTTATAVAAGAPAELVGRTPLVRLARFEPAPGIEVHAKLESRNPGGSVKDRAALAMILEGERSGALTPDRILLDATSGNTGIAYAMLAAARGYRVTLCVPANVTPERRRLLKAYGAALVETDPMEGTDGAIREAHRLHAEAPGRYFYPDQYANPANWRAHYETTGPEIIEQTEGRVTHFVAGLGTGGTFTGAGRRLRAWHRSVRLISVQPDSPLHGLEGLKDMASAIVPPIYDEGLADEALRIPTEEGQAWARRLAREAGIGTGPSGGAAVAAAVRVASRLDHGVVVTVLPDGIERYLSERFWNEPDPPEPPALRLTDEAARQIRRHGETTFPDECCGALLATPAGLVVEALPLGNTTDLERRRRFLISPDDYRRAEARADDTGHVVAGFYHSHPNHPAVPSAFDLEHAWPNMSYAIVSVRGGLSDELRSWRLGADRAGFTEEHVRRASASAARSR